MNKKRKKQITTAIIFLFFLAGGLWYGITTGGFFAQKDTTKLVGVLSTGQPEAVSATPELSGGITQTAGTEGPESETELVVYVCGAVNQPGIYTLPADSRLYEAITLAGGFSAAADPAYHNLARVLSDGERIYILSAAETKELTVSQQVEGETGGNSAGTETALLNINTATAEQLTALPGIGDAKAASIVEYRLKIGKFTAIEELMNVSGIGEAMFEKIKDKITVK